ncbi:MAG TPA: bifunctional methylenetetrahydrofolate dehydrogenase/methenyltetrahydrofolate cyclohydrolase FolD [Kiritimatiellia bacterium]|nr:bifunctional methylenetetrahydrofolate dehydrogenase/methenyltetrahydrofolate cyclohydrolase FolD [Kiritimatiellia bacterium]HRZ11807.1 bifunctional methylenetetrahydrofolate dehydrogenase/methenyltetrahydrofolate cyclohydrolase FolD [Kiritimatiellia bacterium]HSA17387.1 bifunctional methylenetetrahydrofolate dehydrogenase/methenyltetrahydrofolate cyclohydrolase FolD [Kiritimatiellia bacterium]
MTAKILDGKALSRQLRAELAAQVAALRAGGIVPGLGVLLVGDNPASRAYVTAKEKACGELGMHSSEVRLPASASRGEILRVVSEFNRDPRVHGILVQLPLPDGSMEQEVLETVDPAKDVDGFHPVNVGRAVLGLPAFLPCTPHGILQMLRRAGIPVAGAHAVVIGRSHIVGRPLANLLSQKGEAGNATVTLCHTATRDLAQHTRHADIVIAAAGRPNTVRADMIREGAVVVDVGMNRVADSSAPRGYRLVGDVAFDEVREKASWITPVPGGVGPMTITMLLFNTVAAARGGPAGSL